MVVDPALLPLLEPIPLLKRTGQLQGRLPYQHVFHIQVLPTQISHLLLNPEQILARIENKIHIEETEYSFVKVLLAVLKYLLPDAAIHIPATTFRIDVVRAPGMKQGSYFTTRKSSGIIGQDHIQKG